MSKKGFLASLIIAIVATVSLSVYTILSVCLPSSGTSSNPKNTTVSLAFRSGETVDVLTGCVENKDLTFSVEEGKENPIEYVAETETYVAKDMNSTVTATVKNKKGNKTNYVISVYHHNSGFNAEGAKVDYSETEPFIIATKAHLDEYRTKINEESSEVGKSTVSYAVVVADIDLAGENWKPIGSFNNEAKGIVFEGNNHTIKNLTINVTSENYLEFIKPVTISGEERGYMDLGLFGKMKRNCEIRNLKIEGANINVDSNVYTLLKGEVPEEAEYKIFDEMSIGIVAGQANESTFKNISTKGTIKGFSYRAEDALWGAEKGIGGIVGVIRNSQITDSQVELNFVEISKTYSKEANLTYGQYDSTTVGGIVGYAGTFTYTLADHDDFLNLKNLVENCTVSLTAKTYFHNVSNIAGLVGVGENIDIKDSVVKKIKVVDTTAEADATSHDLSYVSNVGGVTSWIYNNRLDACAQDQRYLFESSIQNVKVENIDVAMLGGHVAGLALFVGENGGRSFEGASIKIVDCSVKGSFVATVGSGISEYLGEESEVSYTENFTGNAVEANISAKSASAIAYKLYGSVKGFATSLGERQTQRTNVVVNFNGTQNKLEADANRDVAYDNTFGSTFGYIGKEGSSEKPVVEELAINIVSNNSMSFSGIAHKSYGAQIRNCDVVATAVSYNYSVADKNYSTTYMVAGVVANAYEGTTIEGVSVNIKVNKGVDANVKRGFNFFGGVVARIHDNDVSIKNCTVDADVYSNYVYDQSLKVSEESVGKIFLAGGLVGAIQKYKGTTDGIDNLAPVLSQEDINNGKELNLTIENNNVKFSIFADFAENALSEGSNSMGSNGYRSRGIGALVGNFNSFMKAGTYLDLSTNVAEYHVKADKVTFTYGYQVSSKLVTMNTLGLKIENNAISDTICRSFGMSYLLNASGNSFVIENMENITATFENR